MAFLDKTGLERLWLHILSKTNQTLASAKQYADDIKNDLLNGAGGAYDTLKELGDLIDENADAIDAIERLADTKSDKGHIHDDRYYTEAEIDAALAGKVDKVAGKGLSTNDFTTAEKEKLSRLSETGSVEVDSELSDNSENPVQNKVINDALKFLKKSEGNIVTITDGAAHSAIELISHIEPVQSGSGDPSSSNVRPINGWDAVGITRTGKNLFGGDALADKLVSVISATKDTAAGTISFSASKATGQEILTGVFKPNTQYTFVFYGNNTNPAAPLNLRIVYSDGTDTTPVFSEPGKNEQRVIYSEQGKTVEKLICVYWDGLTTLYYNQCGVYEGVIEAAQFEPYNGTALTATLPETIYGGTLDWKTGVLTVTHKKGVINNASGLYSTTDNLTGFYTNVPDMAAEGRANGWCEILPARNTPSGATSPCITFGAGYHDLFIIMPKTIIGTTLETINAYLTNNPLNIVYPLATPTTYQLTPQQLETLKGTNNAWSDCGETELTYATIRTDEIEKVLIDPTLSIKGTAAEAQIVGKELQHLQKETQFLDEAKGSFITVDNSAELPLNNLKLYGKTTQATTTGKNLLSNHAVSKTESGVTFTVNADGSVQLNGTATAVVIFGITEYAPLDLSGLNVTLSGGLSSDIKLISTDNVNALLSMEDIGYGVTYDGYPNLNVCIYITAGTVCNNVTVYPMIRVSSNTDTTYEPYTGGIPSPNPDYPQELKSPGDNGSIGVYSKGKNLLTNISVNDVFLVSNIVQLYAGTTYTFSVDKIPDALYFSSTDGTTDYAKKESVTQLTYTPATDIEVRLYARYGAGPDTSTQMQLEVGNTATAYEPYKDGGTLAISTPNGLPGIKVSSGGNYTDASGQQWVCDEIDFERGAYVQRVRQLVLNGTEGWSTNDPSANNYIYYIHRSDIGASECLCDKFTAAYTYELLKKDNIVTVTTEYGGTIYIRSSSYMTEDTQSAFKAMLAQYTPTVMYILATPIETPLSESELASYRAMLTQYPTTTIYNDAAADMYASYGTYKAGEMEEALSIPKVDKTLSTEGAAADAKTVGDILNNQYSVQRETGNLISVDTIEGLAIHPTTYIEPVQSGSGDASPDNVRPISGWDSVAVQRTGKNICPGYKIGAYINNSGVYTDAYLTYRCTELIRVSGGETLAESHGGTAVREACHCYNSEKKWLGTVDINNRPAGTAYIAINYMGDDLQWVQVEVGNTATAYEPYQGQTLTASLRETVYGGTLDWTTGKLQKTKQMYQFTGDETVRISSSGYIQVVGIYNPNIELHKGVTYTGTKNIICSHFEGCAYGDFGESKVVLFAGVDGTIISFCASDLADVSTFKTYLSEQYNAGTPVTIVFDLLPAYKETLIVGTPQQLSTIEGQNNIWSNAGKTEALINLTPINVATLSKATNLVNGSTSSSVRMISATEESDSYTMGSSAFAVGSGTKASGSRSHASGSGVVASGDCAHAEGFYCEATGDYSHAEGSYAKATGNGGCHAEGNNTEATGWCTHAEGSSTKATTNYAHAEGNGSTASGYISHAEGNSCQATGYVSHAEGNQTIAEGSNSHAEGQYANAKGSTSHAEGTNTIASGSDQHAQGRYNIEDTASTYAHIVGNGTSNTARSNAHTLDWYGNAWFKGSIYVGGTGQTDTAAVMVLPAKLVSTETTPTTNNTIYWLYE